MSRVFWAVLAAGVTLSSATAGASSNPYKEALAFSKAHAAFVNVISVDLGPSGNDIRESVLHECAEVSLNKMRVYALKEGVKSSIEQIGGNRITGTLIASILGEVAKIDESASQELRCLAVLTIARQGDPETWKFVDDIGSAPKHPLRDIERIIDASRR
ncbi:hypothetical protein ACCS61_36015 [Rhizobium ruizarguesonis]